MGQDDSGPRFLKESLMGVGVRSTEEAKESWRTIYGSFSKTSIRREARPFSPHSPPGLSGLHCSEAAGASRHVGYLCSFIIKHQPLLLLLLPLPSSSSPPPPPPPHLLLSFSYHFCFSFNLLFATLVFPGWSPPPSPVFFLFPLHPLIPPCVAVTTPTLSLFLLLCCFSR